MKLYHYWRSTSSWRVRWGLAFKGIECEMIAVDLLSGGADSPEHLKRNPMGYVPVLEVGGVYLAESFAILEWLEETQPKPALLPGDPLQRARIRQLCELINSGTQPLQNLGVAERHSPDPDEKKRWQQDWIKKGLSAYEQIAAPLAGNFSLGDAFTLADIFLAPQCYSAGRNDVALSAFPTVARIYENVQKTDAYAKSHPDRYKPSSS